MTFHAFLPPWLLGAIEEAGDATVILKAGDRPYVIKSDSPYHLGSAPITALALEAIAQQILSDTAQERLYSEGSVEVTLERQRIPVAVRADRLDNELVIRLRNPAAAAQPAATAPQAGSEPVLTASAPGRDLDIEVDISLDPDADDGHANLAAHADEGGLDEHRRQLIAALREAASSEDIRTIIGKLASKLDAPVTNATPRVNGNGKGDATTHAYAGSDAVSDGVREDLRQEPVSEEPAPEESAGRAPAFAETARDAAAREEAAAIHDNAVRVEVAREPAELEAAPLVEAPVPNTPEVTRSSAPGTSSSRWPDLPAAVAASAASDPIKTARSEPATPAASPEPSFPDLMPVARPAAPAPSTLIIRRGQIAEAARREAAEQGGKRSIFARLASKIGLTRDAEAAPPVVVRHPDKTGTDRVPEMLEEPKPHEPAVSEPIVAQPPAVRPPDPRDVPTSVGRFYARSMAQLRAIPPGGGAELASPAQQTGTADATADVRVTPELATPPEAIGSMVEPPSELSVVAEGVVTPELVARAEPTDASEPIALADVILAPEATLVEQAAPELPELSEFAAISGETAAPELTLVSDLAIVEQAAPDAAELSDLAVIADDAIAPEIIGASAPSERFEPIAIVEPADVAGISERWTVPELTAVSDLPVSPEAAIVEQVASEFVEVSVVVDQAVTPERWAPPESNEVSDPAAAAEAQNEATPEHTVPEELYTAIEPPMTPELTAVPELTVSPEPARVEPPAFESVELLVPAVGDEITATPASVEDHDLETLAMAEPAATQELDAAAEAVAFELTPPPESIGEPESAPVLEDVGPDVGELPSLGFVDEEPASQELTETIELERLVADAASTFKRDNPAEEVSAFAAVSEHRAVAERTSLDDVTSGGGRFAVPERIELDTPADPGFMARLVSRIGFSRNPEVSLPAAELRRRFESVVGRAQNDTGHDVPEPTSAVDVPTVIDAPAVEPAVPEETLEAMPTLQPDAITEDVTLNATMTPVEPVTPIPDAAIPEADPSPEPSTVTANGAEPVPMTPPEPATTNEQIVTPELTLMPETIATSEPIIRPEASSAAPASAGEPAPVRLMTALPVAAEETVFVPESDPHEAEPVQYAESGAPGDLAQVTPEPAAYAPPQEDMTAADQPEGDAWPESMERVMRQERPKAVATLVDLGRRRAVSAATADLGDWIAEAMDRSASALYLRVGSAPFARIDGQVEALASDLMPISMFERAGAMLTAGEDGWRKGGEGEWIKYVPAMGAIRCQVFADEKGGGFIVRLPGAAASSLGHRVPRHLRAACETGDGLIVLSAPFAEDVTAMVTAVAACAVTRHSGYVVAFGTNGALESVARHAFVSERPAPAGHHEMSVAIQAALHERPDVLIVNTNGGRIWNADAIVGAAVGRLVIVGLIARTAPRSIDILLSELAQAPQALASVFRAACSWRGFRRSAGKMVLSDVLIGTEHVAALIEEGNIAGLQQAQRNHEGGMRTLDAALGSAVARRKITLREAAAAAVDRSELVSLVLRKARERRAAERTRPETGV